MNAKQLHEWIKMSFRNKKKETFKRIYILLRRVIFALCIFRRFKVLRRLFFTMFFLSIIWFMHVSARSFFSFISRFVRFCSVHVRFMFFLSFYSILYAFYIILISTMIGYCIIVCRPHFDFIVLTNDHSSVHNHSPSIVAFFPITLSLCKTIWIPNVIHFCRSLLRMYDAFKWYGARLWSSYRHFNINKHTYVSTVVRRR